MRTTGSPILTAATASIAGTIRRGSIGLGCWRSKAGKRKSGYRWNARNAINRTMKCRRCGHRARRYTLPRWPCAIASWHGKLGEVLWYSVVARLWYLFYDILGLNNSLATAIAHPLILTRNGVRGWVFVK